ncbi:proline-serine-threonine phosphatase-interacting protein 2 isoform X1, partial [Tachysurus ichikawai]
LYEEVRKSLEQCDIQEDIEHFINLRRTGDKPPAPILYENFYSNQRTVPNRQPPSVTRRGAAPPPPNTEGDVYSTIGDPGYSVIRY